MFDPATRQTPPVAWSPDDRFFIYGGPMPQVMNADTGEHWALVTSSQQPWNGTAAWSPDGSFVLLTVESRRDEGVIFWSDVVAKLRK